MIRKHFGSCSEFVAYFRTLIPNNKGHYLGDAIHGASILENGTQRYNDQIEKFNKTLWGKIPTLQRVWELAPSGAFPSVPSFLAGEPANMWTIEHEKTDRTPVRIWIGITSSAGVSAEELVERGAALSAFAQTLGQIRPVYLTPYTLCGNGNHEASFSSVSKWVPNDVILSWDLQTSPIVMSEIAAALCEERVSRELVFNITYHLMSDVPYAGSRGYSGSSGWMGGWAYKYDDEEYMRGVLGAAPDDVWLGGIHLYDQLRDDPIQWIQDKLAKYAAEE